MNITKYLVFILALMLMVAGVSATQAPVTLGAANGFSVVAQTLISDATPAASHITGNVNMDPAAGSLIHDISCKNVVGTIYDNNAGYTGGYDSNTSCLVTDAVTTLAVQQAMVTAYNDARGRTGPDATELGSGNIGGMTLHPGLYKWSTGVTIPTDVTLDCLGNTAGVYVFQIGQTLTVSNGKKIILAGGCRPGNIFWQTDTSTTIGTTAVFNGNILAGTAITVNAGAVLNGRAFAQTAVTMSANNVTIPTVLVCTPNWGCTHYGICQPDNKEYCDMVVDPEVCGQTYAGNFSEFPTVACTAPNPAGGGSSGGNSITVGGTQAVMGQSGSEQPPASTILLVLGAGALGIYLLNKKK